MCTYTRVLRSVVPYRYIVVDCARVDVCVYFTRDALHTRITATPIIIPLLGRLFLVFGRRLHVACIKMI